MKTDDNPPPESPSRERVMLDDDPADIAIVQEAERQREAAFHASYQWRGKALHPYSISREALYYALRSMSCTVPLHVAVAAPEVFLQDALILLYLCSHNPADWSAVRHDVPAFLAQISAWADEHVPRAMGSEACDLAQRILHDAHVTEAVAKPTGRGESQEGN